MDLRETKGWSYGVRGNLSLLEHRVPDLGSQGHRASGIGAGLHDPVDRQHDGRWQHRQHDREHRDPAAQAEGRRYAGRDERRGQERDGPAERKALRQEVFHGCGWSGWRRAAADLQPVVPTPAGWCRAALKTNMASDQSGRGR